MELGLRRSARVLVGLISFVPAAGTAAVYLTTIDYSWWQYVVSGMFQALLVTMAVVWYFTCWGLIRAAKIMGDELERVSDLH
jgi:uncharacterized membrane protein